MPYVKKDSLEFKLVKFDDPIAKTERKDCAVRALANIINDYPKAHEIFTSFGREHRKGTFGYTINAVFTDDELMLDLGYKVKKLYQRFDFSKNTEGNLTMAKLKEYYPQGKYYVTTNKHAFALINGVIYDNFPSGKCRRIEELYLLIPND